MSRRIWVENMEDNALVDAEDVTLSDPTAAYGIKETVSGNVVVASGAAVTHDEEEGRYYYDISSLDTAKEYDACFRVRRTSGSIDFSEVHIPIASSGGDPLRCIVSGTLYDVSGEPVANNAIEIAIDRSKLPRFTQHYLLGGTVVKTETDEDGRFSVSLLRGALVTMHVKESGMKCQFTVPDMAQVDLEDVPGEYGVIEDEDNPF